MTWATRIEDSSPNFPYGERGKYRKIAREIVKLEIGKWLVVSLKDEEELNKMQFSMMSTGGVSRMVKRMGFKIRTRRVHVPGGGIELCREAYAKFGVYYVGPVWWGQESMPAKSALPTRASAEKAKPSKANAVISRNCSKT